MQALAKCQQQRAAASGRCFSRPSTSRVCRSVQTKAVAEPQGAGRREILLGAASAAILPAFLAQQPALADGEYSKFIGFATPPTSYGGYGGNANEEPKYTFEYPPEWKSEVPSKVEKGTQGVDGRVVNPKGKDQRAFVITLGRAGEDNARFQLTDLDSTFAGFAGADYYLQDALTDASEITRSEREADGVKFYQYDIDSPEFRYLASIAVKDGKVFALFVRSPARIFAKSEASLRHIIDTFFLL